MNEDRPNIVLLTADALRADHRLLRHRRHFASCSTRSIRKVWWFTNAYSASSHTGRRCQRFTVSTRCRDWVRPSARDRHRRRRSEAGFATAGFHLKPVCVPSVRVRPRIDTFDDDLHLGQHKLIALAQRAIDKPATATTLGAAEINERSLEWIDSQSDDEPFFLWNHYMDTHGPCEPPGEYATLYADRELSGREAQSLYPAGDR